MSMPPRDVSGDYDDRAYLIPMGIFLALTWVGGQWASLYPLSYLAKTLIVPVALWVGWKYYTKITWDYWWLGIIVGVIGIIQWVPMQLGLQQIFPGHFAPDESAFNPRTHFASATMMWGFIAVRLIGATLVVPVMEELFWRDFIWRTLIAPKDFKLARIGEAAPLAVFGTAAAFSIVHGNWWLTSIVWALLIAALLISTRSLGAAIIAHATTNLLLGLYVLYQGFQTSNPQWWFW